MTAATPPAADPPPAPPTRYAVYFRRRTGEPWTEVATVGDRAAAERLLVHFAATAKRGGDWRIDRTEPLTPPRTT